MIFNFQKYNYFFETSGYLNNSKPVLMFLHGFASDSRDWNEVIHLLPDTFHWITIDLPGFGKSNIPADTKFYSSEFMVELLNEFTNYLNVEKINLVGYSMGGRLALSYVKKNGHKLSSLILESTSPGLKTENERRLRIASDAALAEYIKSHTLQDFINYWKSLPLFNSQKKLTDEENKLIFKRMLELNKNGLIGSLSGFGAGTMSSLWNSLDEITVPTLLISGQLDEKYLGINSEMSELIPNSEWVILEDAGHNTHLEKPEEFVNLLCSFVQKH
ncbi:MAG: 2-succinyl-6-hydroxy-2,4-cyclohexadiene-1-carboxylate synthase [Ignavibacteria bacterium]|nr:2-succinyl-6-hydroxy-2,4-cyclohexadiene-1-carboxylate synthase [Ignavibacteria bacterium]